MSLGWYSFTIGFLVLLFGAAALTSKPILNWAKNHLRLFGLAHVIIGALLIAVVAVSWM